MVFQTLRSFAARMGVPLTAAVLAAPFLVTRAAAQGGSLPSGGSFVGLALQNFTPYHSLTGDIYVCMYVSIYTYGMYTYIHTVISPPFAHTHTHNGMIG